MSKSNVRWMMNSNNTIVLSSFYTESFLQHLLLEEKKDVKLHASICINKDKKTIHCTVYHANVAVYEEAFGYGHKGADTFSNILKDVRKKIYNTILDTAKSSVPFYDIDDSIVDDWEKTWVE